jgi:hypothetical protein
MSGEASHFCERCQRRVVALRPPWAYRAASIGALLFFLILTVAAGASGSLLLGGGVIVFILGTLVLGPLNEMASEPARCPSCHCVVFPVRAAGMHRVTESAPEAVASGNPPSHA